jgi:cytochrome c oxidase accessory protein FixG
LCVQVCPTGIDIRQGLQMACIGCAACIDACDQVMDKMGYASGLIGYKSERQLQGGVTRWLRPRLLGYAAALTVMIGALILALHLRPMVSLDVIKDRGLFRENALGQIENIYLLKVINKTSQPQQYQLRLLDADGFALYGRTTFTLAAGEMSEQPVSVALLAERPSRSAQTLTFQIQGSDNPDIRSSAQSRFVAPLNR